MSEEPRKEARIKTSVHITNYYHENSGGVKTNYDRLLVAANEEKRLVRLIVPSQSTRIETVGDFGKIYYVSAPPAPFIDKRYRIISPLHYLLAESVLRNILLKEMPQVVEIYDNAALMALAGIIRKGHFAGLGRPMLIYFTGERFDTIFTTFVMGGKPGKRLAKGILANLILPLFDYYIANSRFVAEELSPLEKGFADLQSRPWLRRKSQSFFRAFTDPLQDRIAISPRGVDTEFFSPSRRSLSKRKSICEDAGVPEESVLLFSSTRLSLEKNVDMLLDIMWILAKGERHDFRLLIAGAGPRKNHLREIVDRKLPGKIIFVGHLDKCTLADYYANIDIFVHPNAREPFGNVGLEAMASGAAAVVTDTGGVLEYANNENAWTVNADAGSFADAIRSAATENGLRQRKIENAILTASRNSNEAAMKRLFSTYDRFYSDFIKRPIFSKRP